jgi:hypothetical protein
MILSTTWFTEGTIDFELQKYRLLAYLKEVNACFGEAKLYPQLADVIFHYKNLTAFRSNKRFLEDQFPRRIDEVNLQRIEIIYEKMLADDELMNELENITGYAEEKLKGTIETGTEIYEQVARQLTIEPIGLLPAYKDEGYFLLRYGNYREVRAYSYNISLFEEQSAKYRGLRVHYLQSFVPSLTHTFTHIKSELVRQYSALRNPAFYCLETPLPFPLDETILPVAKRAFVRYLAIN